VRSFDGRLKVKGVWKPKTVDASVFLGHVSGNIMSTTYAATEKGTDLMRTMGDIDET
jgi:hypothetical protein